MFIKETSEPKPGQIRIQCAKFVEYIRESQSMPDSLIPMTYSFHLVPFFDTRIIQITYYTFDE